MTSSAIVDLMGGAKKRRSKASKKASRSSKRASKRTSKRTSKRSSKRTSKRASKRSSKKASKRSSKRTSKRSSKRRSKRGSNPAMTAYLELVKHFVKITGFKGGPAATVSVSHYKKLAVKQHPSLDTIAAIKKAKELIDSDTQAGRKKVYDDAVKYLADKRK